MKREFHRFCLLFEEMDSENLEMLVADIKERGLQENIVLSQDGKILDGRNRYLACLKAGIDPEVFLITRKGTDKELLAWVLGRNLHRRHLDASQRSMLMAKLKEELVRQGDLDRGAILHHLEKLGNVSERSIKKAVKVRKNGSKKLQRAVEKGEVSVSAAYEISDYPKNNQNSLLKQGAVVEAANLDKLKSPVLGSFVALCENWTAASPATRSDFRAFIDPQASVAAPNGANIDRFGRERAPPGSLLKKNGPSGKHGKVEK